MNSIRLKNQLCQRFQILTKARIFAKKNFSTKSEDESPSKEEEARVIRKGILHDKQQSVKEESYFHQEEKEQLKMLKQKMKGSQAEKSEKDDKN